MKILIVGNHTCGNRGDAAILRGLISELRAQSSTVEIDIISRFPVSSSYLLNETLLPDELDDFHRGKKGIKAKLSKVLFPWLLRFSTSFFPQNLLPKHLKNFIDTVRGYDAVIQVGGSFFVDLYGETQFEHALCALNAKVPIYLLGHSVGPFERPRFKSIAKMVFNNVNVLSLRESVSLEHLNKLECENVHLSAGADTAWLVPPETSHLDNHWFYKFTEKSTVAITVRTLAPFDKRLGVTQQSYENAIASLCKELIAKGYRVALLSTCTGIDSYNRDDRMVALKIANEVENPAECFVVMDEINDIELGQCLYKCVLTVGTRLHSAIISMNFNTPAIALNYEHKSKGIMEQLGIAECSSDLSDLFDGTLTTKVFTLLNKIESNNFDIVKHVDKERQRARQMVTEFLEDSKSF